MKHLTLIILLSGLVILSACSEHPEEKKEEILNTVLSNLEEIKSADFSSYGEAWAPGDTVPAVAFENRYIAYDNPADTTLGTSWVVVDNEDATQLRFAYDGHMRASVYKEEKGIMIDSFTFRKRPFRPVKTPFYWYTRDILQYALTTEDSITLDVENLSDVIHVKLTIHEDQQVEFFGRAHHMPVPPYGHQDPTSRYELWINKRTLLPYKYRREMEHNISTEEVLSVEFNMHEIIEFNAASYFPADYTIRQYGDTSSSVPKPHKLMGKVAPEWMLTDEYGEKLALQDITSKVILLQFTSVNCGPCRASIPSLNKLASQYDRADLEVIAVETYTKNTNVLSTYKKRTGLDYTFLMSEKEVNSAYNIRGTPVIFILDADRIIQEVVNGYGGESTDNQIIKSIARLI